MPEQTKDKTIISHKSEPADHEDFGLGQVVIIHVVNKTEHNISLIQKRLDWGRWRREPAFIIPRYEDDSFSSEGTILGGIEGTVEYSIPDARFKIYWSLSHQGHSNFKWNKTDPQNLYDISLVEQPSINTVTINVSKK